MPITLLNTGQHLSLEFEEGDLERVGAKIRESYPEASSRWSGIVKVYAFGGCEFTFQNEWEDPCLISGSNEGDAILRSLHSGLHGS